MLLLRLEARLGVSNHVISFLSACKLHTATNDLRNKKLQLQSFCFAETIAHNMDIGTRMQSQVYMR